MKRLASNFLQHKAMRQWDSVQLVSMQRRRLISSVEEYENSKQRSVRSRILL
jgi:hypothetical protein